MNVRRCAKKTERGRFELPVLHAAHLISSQARSTAPAPLHVVTLMYAIVNQDVPQ